MAPVRFQDDLVLTISDNDDISDEESGELEEQVPASTLTKRKRENGSKASSSIKKQKRNEDGDAQPFQSEANKVDDGMDSDFEFDGFEKDLTFDDFHGWALKDVDESTSKDVDSIENLVARRLSKRKQSGVTREDSMSPESHASSDVEIDEDDVSELEDEADEDGDEDEEEEEEDEELDTEELGQLDGREIDDEDSDAEERMVADPMPEPEDDDESEAEEMDAEEAAKSKAFFADTPVTKDKMIGQSFLSMGLSRPINKGLYAAGFTEPTPIQAKTIPVALEGKDVVGGAVTGSGKTGAFMIPILERLFYRSRRIPVTRVAILMPTRELALQCLAVAKKLAAFTDITFGRAIGGLNSREQEKELKLRPDVVIATPGRFIDFMRNSTALEVDKIEILVLDEADRMLEEGFADELNEILSTIPKSRQTMLFSATMTSRIDDLVRAGLQKPVRIMVDAQKASASGLVQEFVRLRAGREDKRLGYLMHICSKIHTDRVIIFFRQKKEAHRVRVIFALCNMKAAELHGSVSQEQRINAVESFRSGKVSFLLATDLASRGLDIKGIDTVINYEAPQSHEIYLHRVGRTARAGRKGVSCTLAAEPDRKIVKAAVKAGKAHNAVIRQLTVDVNDANAWQQRCDDLADEVEEILREEKEEHVMQQTERDIQRVENVVKYEDEIKSRPKKTWFATEKDKLAAKQKGAELLNGPFAAGSGADAKKGKRVKLSNKQKKKLDARDERRDGHVWRGKSKDERGLSAAAMKEKVSAKKPKSKTKTKTKPPRK